VRVALVLLLCACTGEIDPIGLDEPLRVHGGVLRQEEMPGGPDAEGPTVSAIETAGGLWSQGQLDRTLGGRVSDDTFAIGVALGELGSGYWTHPVGAPDPAFAGERRWDILLDVGGGTPAGIHRLRTVAIDEEGRGGPWGEIDVCVIDPRLPGDLTACDATLPPPAAVITIAWDENSDVDLALVTPDGKTVDARHPTTAGEEPPIPTSVLDDPHVGRLDGDSLAECIPDGRNAESVTWREDPAPGLYNVYANLFDACGHPSARFTVITYRREARDDGTFALVASEPVTGILLAPSANGGGGQPLYVTTVSFP
jgi:hypothetical protein